MGKESEKRRQKMKGMVVVWCRVCARKRKGDADGCVGVGNESEKRRQKTKGMEVVR